MPQTRRFLKYWLPVLLWIALIFSASTDALSSSRTSRIIGPLLRWLMPDLSEQTVYRVVFAVRKTAHVAEYAVLALLLWRAWRQPQKKDQRPWRWSEAACVFALVALYAVSDEFHQWFVPSREGRIRDVLLDTAGAALGLLGLWMVGRWRKRW